jgi:hypothetical protein
MRPNKEKKAEYIYNKVLRDIIEPMTGDNSTYLTQLNGVGHKLFGCKFKGVFPSDKIPKLNDLAPYAILNLDTSKEPGSHWIAIAKYPHENKTIMYDSFGRSDKKIIPTLKNSHNGIIYDADSTDVEQKLLETNCGARCLAFLVVYDRWGEDYAKLI